MDNRLNNLFILYLDSPRRRNILSVGDEPKGDSYLLYGLHEYQKSGLKVRHNLEKPKRSSRIVHIMSWLINKSLRLYGGIGGDFRSVISNLHSINQSDVVLSTSDTVGIPLSLFKARGWVKPPMIYVSIGLPERIQRFRSERVVENYCKLFSKVDTFVGYGYEECRLLKSLIKNGVSADSVYFVPFGVDADFFSPVFEKKEYPVDFLTIGADSQRDFSLLLALARNNSSYNFEIITSKDQRDKFEDIPGNIRVMCDIPLELMKRRLEETFAVILPIKENSYSGATTTLLQAMAMEKPVIVSRVGAIRNGYHLEDGYNCLFVEPGNEEQLAQKANELLSNLHLRNTIAKNARKTVLQHLTWDHYLDSMNKILHKRFC